MPLRRTPSLTPRSLAARRANALKSTGPRTARGKARVSLNALQHGRSAARSTRLRERLLRAGYRHQEAFYGGFRSRIGQAFEARDPRSRRRIDRFATEAWCAAAGRRFSRTKLECALDSRARGSRVLYQHQFVPLRFRVEDNWRRIGVAFWVQRRRYLTVARLERVLQGLEPPVMPGPGEGLESRVYCLVFRLRRPGYLERLRYSLDRNGNPDWNREPWKSLPGPAREAYDRRAAEEATYSSLRQRRLAEQPPAVELLDGSDVATQLGNEAPTPAASLAEQTSMPSARELRGVISRLRSRFFKLMPSRSPKEKVV